MFFRKIKKMLRLKGCCLLDKFTTEKTLPFNNLRTEKTLPFNNSLHTKCWLLSCISFIAFTFVFIILTDLLQGKKSATSGAPDASHSLPTNIN